MELTQLTTLIRGENTARNRVPHQVRLLLLHQHRRRAREDVYLRQGRVPRRRRDRKPEETGVGVVN